MKKLICRYLGSLMCFLIAFSSCENKSTFLFDTKEVDYISDSKPLIKGSDVSLEILGVDRVFVCDTLLMFTTNDPSGMLQIFNKNTLSPIAKLATQGRAKNEFISISNTNWQYYYRDGDLIIPFIDNYCFLKEINISQSILQGHTVIASDVSECINTADGSFVLLDDDLNNRFECLFPHPDAVLIDNLVPVSYSIHNCEDQSFKEIRVFPKMMECERKIDLDTYYKNRLSKHPTKNIVVQPFGLLDYILFFDFENKHNFAIHNQGSRSFSEVVPSVTLDTPSYFSGHCFSSTKDFFMLLYFADQYSIKSNSLPELLVFDWDGNYLGGAKLGNYINSMSYDSINQILYGVSYFEEKIFTFDLSILMASIVK